MQLYSVPLDENLNDYSFPITLSGQRYTVGVRYNVRNDRWMLSISDAAGNLLIAGLVLLLRRPLLPQYTTLDLPAGFLIVDYDGDDQPGVSAFLTTHTLYFVTP